MISLQSDRIDLVWDREIMPMIRPYHIRVARDALAEEQRRGFDGKPRTIIDRRGYDAPLESVKPFGVIEYASRTNVRAVAAWVFEQVVQLSPVDTGRYQDSHVLMVNGETVDLLPDDLGPNDRVQIVNITPYARKIERGYSELAPNGVYRRVASAAKNRFRDAFIDHKWVKLEGVGPAQTMGRVGGRTNAAGVNNQGFKMRDTVYPAIQIYQGARK